MLFLEHDAKELLAIQGVPIPGGVRLAQVPTVAGAAEDGGSGPWIVKPQIFAGAAERAPHDIAARTNQEIANATAALLDKSIGGQLVRAVYVEQQMFSQSEAYLSFRCDPQTAGIRIEMNAGGEESLSEVVAPDPNAVIACVNRLSTSLPGPARGCIAAAGRMLAPLYFGYEAMLLEIDPLTILRDGSWAVGDVRLAIDENALSRHPELISLVERRDYSSADTRRLRRYGVDYRVLDPDGTVGTIAFGAGLAAALLDELIARGLGPYNFMDAGRAAQGPLDEALNAALGWLQDGAALRCILVAAGDGAVDLTQFAAQLAAALAGQPGFKLPLVARLTGTGAGAAGAILQQAYGPIQLEPQLDAALDLVEALSAGHAP
jgi:succinyl-CoA synthetase beta subunit